MKYLFLLIVVMGGSLVIVLSPCLLLAAAAGSDPPAGLALASPPQVQEPQLQADVAQVVHYGLAQVGDPYVWGADGPGSFDCSGLTMAAYQQIGVRLPHRSDLQVRHGRAIDWSESGVRPGDLIFLRGGSPVHDYGHVGLAVSSRQWVVAPRSGSRVHVEAIPYRRVQAVRRIVADR